MLNSAPADDAQPATAPAWSPDSAWEPVLQRLRAALADEFDFDAELGRGGMAAVFRARELALNRRVAIKVMEPSLLRGEGMVERFRQEAITVANLQHANIVAVHSVRAVGELQLFVMQYIPGRSLDRVLRDHGPISLEAAQAIVYHVGSALDYAHRRGVVHRDVKPANILLDADGDPVVTDFGIAKIAEAPGHTRVGAVIGTPTYMSPEQCLGYDVGPASDQYALGVVMYALLTGQVPFGGNEMALMRAQIETPPPPLRQMRTEIPERIEAAVLRMLAKKPEDRFPDLVAAIAAFGAQPLGAVGPLRTEMTELADAKHAETHLAEIVKGQRRQPTPNVSWRPPVVSVEIDAPREPVEVGDCIVLPAYARSDTGAHVGNMKFIWVSSNPRIATVDAAGVLTAVSPGTTTITASAGAASGNVDVTIIAPGVASIEVSAPAELRVGARAVLVARALNRHGAQLEVPVTWASRNPRVATITAVGVISANQRGTAVVVVEAGVVARPVTITVIPAAVVDVTIDGIPAALAVGAAATLRAVTRVPRGANDAGDRTVQWASSDTSVASVSDDGVVTGRSPGQAMITVACDGARSAAVLTVVRVVAASIVVPVPSGPVRLGDRIDLEATAYDATGKSVSRPITWSSTAPLVASVDQAGKVTAVTEGWAIVTATVDGVNAHVEIVVRQQLFPVSAVGRRELRRLALKWWLVLAVVVGIVALGWQYLRP